MDVQIVYSPAPGPAGGVALVDKNTSVLNIGSQSDTSDFVFEIKAAFPRTTWAGTWDIFDVHAGRSFIRLFTDGRAQIQITDAGGGVLGSVFSVAGSIPDNVQGILRGTYDGVNAKLFWNGGEIATVAATGTMDLSRTGISFFSDDGTATSTENVTDIEYLRMSRDGEATQIVNMGPQNAAAWNAGTNAGTAGTVTLVTAAFTDA